VLRAADEPYVLCASGANVSGGATLRIEPGVTVLAAPGAVLRVRRDGVLQALGTEASPIRFLGEDPTPGSWTGIWHESGSQQNELTWVEIAHGGTSVYANLFLGDGARIRIRNSTFRDAGTWGINVGASNVSLPEFRANRFHGNALTPIRIFANQMRWLDGESRFTGNGRDLIEVRPADLTGEPHVWRGTAVPFLMTSYVTVSTRLEIEPGFRLLAADGAGSIRVRSNGSIRALGTAGEPIRFTGETGEPGAWSGLWIESESGNLLHFVEIAHGGRGSYHNIHLGSGAAVTVESSIIRESAAFGINVASRTASLTQTGNYFRNNASGDLRTGLEVLALGGTLPFDVADLNAQVPVPSLPDPEERTRINPDQHCEIGHVVTGIDADGHIRCASVALGSELGPQHTIVTGNEESLLAGATTPRRSRASCPAGWKVISGGWTTTHGRGLRVSEHRPWTDSNREGWQVGGYNSSMLYSVTFHAYAICMAWPAN
jgi:hypothetical protein